MLWFSEWDWKDLVGSTLSDPYLAYSAALFALAGPLHGCAFSIVSVVIVLTHLRLANQEVLRWQTAMQKELGDNITLDNIKDYLWKTLKSGQVIPGWIFVPFCVSFLFDLTCNVLLSLRYGHGVLRSPDPRFIALQQFIESRPELKSSPSIDLVHKVRFTALQWRSDADLSQTFQVAPGVLKEQGKVGISVFGNAMRLTIIYRPRTHIRTWTPLLAVFCIIMDWLSSR